MKCGLAHFGESDQIRPNPTLIIFEEALRTKPLTKFPIPRHPWIWHPRARVGTIYDSGGNPAILS